ncbi:hypothetical protein IJT10_00035 [bacterium]|nr:hypothetical protein [bacterium]
MSIAERVCPVCGKTFVNQNEDGANENSNFTVCGRCSFVYHDACWEEHKNCVVFGCHCTHREAIVVGDPLPEKIACPKCNEKINYSASICTHCGEVLERTADVAIFSSKGGWQADSDRELCVKALNYWESSVRHLYNGDFEYWLRGRGYEKLAEVARECRTTEKQRSIGLQKFLDASGYTEKPILKLSNRDLFVEGASNEVDLAVDIHNGGKGYLYGTLSCDCDWLIIQPQIFSGNKERIMITVDLEAVQDVISEAHIKFQTSGGEDTVTVKAHKIDIKAALKLYDDGEYFAARSLCRKLIDAHYWTADAVILSVACCLQEDNEIGATSDLHSLSGKCENIPSTIASKVFKWLQKTTSGASLEREIIYSALEPVADDSMKEELQKSLARLNLDHAQMSIASGSGDGTLWKDEKHSSHDISESLHKAAEMDPTLAAEISEAETNMRKSKSVFSLGFMIFLLTILFLSLVAGGFYLYGTGKFSEWGLDGKGKIDKTALIEGDLSKDIGDLRVEYKSDKEEPKFHARYMAALLSVAEKFESEHNFTIADSYMSRIITDGANFPLGREIVMARIDRWVDKLRAADMEEEAYLRARQGLLVDSEDAHLQKVVSELQSKYKDYYELFNSMGRFDVSVMTNYKNDDKKDGNKAKNKGSFAVFERLGVNVYSGSFSCRFVDVNGDGVRELVIAGFDKDKATKGKCAIYAWKGVILKKNDEIVVENVNRLVNIFAARLTSDKSEELLLIWNNENEETGKNKIISLLLGYKNYKLCQDLVEDDFALEFSDRNNDGSIEIWKYAKIGDYTDIEEVLIPAPYSWDKTSKMKEMVNIGDFDEFYKNFIKSLEKQISENPYDDNPEKKIIHEDSRRQAIEVLKKRIVGKK